MIANLENPIIFNNQSYLINKLPFQSLSLDLEKKIYFICDQDNEKSYFKTTAFKDELNFKTKQIKTNWFKPNFSRHFLRLYEF